MGFWFGCGSVDRTSWFGSSAEPHRTAWFGRTRTRTERFGRSLIKTVTTILIHKAIGQISQASLEMLNSSSDKTAH